MKSSQLTGTARLCLIPQTAAIMIEDQLRIARRREPVVLGDFSLQLARPPAGIAKGEKHLFRPFVVADVAQDLLIGGHRYLAADRQRSGIVIVRAVHDKAEFRLHRSAGKHFEAAFEPRRVIAGRFQQTRN